ncbi:cellulase family glycosylhydrolase [Flavobacterium sp. HTF]|uniref:cellulase family glycosylhydrolase n=1 Tax=Flavobacterium sp. HTF TaxID=2170732 RepID=UPI000D5E5B19|nr:cellulase family glycosylhydrolase [Flavobacterium sp. HTF]PWB23343.1 dihydroxy-acid dehydratase [Flavobacterium sp. HTF]
MKKRIKNCLVTAVLFIVLGGFLSCSAEKETPQNLTVKGLAISTNKIDFQSAESNADLTINSEVTAWLLQSSDASWVKISKAGGTTGTTVVKVTALENTKTTPRTAVITLTSNEAKSLQIAITQAAAIGSDGTYPSYNTNPLPADATGMSNTAVQLAAKLKLGWNIGNTMEATGGETAWGNPKVTKQLIDLVKANGFNAIRIPCSWNQYLSNAGKAEISTTWLNRVKEVVQYCVDNDMYVIVNIHWDNGWLENNVTEAKKDENNAKQKAFWEQIATHLRGFDEHLLFASANEPNVENATQMAVLTSYHQTFIDAVRSTGGKNAYRNLIIQGPSTDIEKTNNLMNTLPTDKVADRMMAEVHYYTPYQFCLMDKDADWGKMFYYWGANYHSTTDVSRNSTWGEETDLDNFFHSMKTKFVDKGVPVILGEFGAIRRSDLTGADLTLHLESRAYFLKYVVQKATANGLVPFYWDAGNLGVNTMSLFDRSNNTVYDAQALKALNDGLK